MSANGLLQHLAEVEESVRALQQELAETNRGLVALMVELESRGDERTAELRTTQEELQRTNSELLQMTLDLEDLVANLLQFSRRGQAQISSVDIREELENTLALIHYHLRNHRITVVRQFASDVPMLHADRQQLRQVFLNLLTNASDAMPQGGSLTLGVTLGQLEPGVPAVVITFTDTGIGIAPEDMPRVMEPFFTTKAAGKGTGLGPAICRRMVQEHHGTFEVSSIVGQGTTIGLTLPCTNATNKTYLRERKL